MPVKAQILDFILQPVEGPTMQTRDAHPPIMPGTAAAS